MTISSGSRSPISWKNWALLWLIVAMVLLSYIDRATLSLFAPYVQSDLGVSETQMGLLFGLGFIGPLALVTFLVGWAVDRYSRILILALGLLVWSVATALCGLAGGFPMLLLARGGVGAGEAVVGPAGYALIASRFPPERRGRATGIVAAAVSVGTGLALMLGSTMLSFLGPDDRVVPPFGMMHNWQHGFLLMGLAGAPLLLALLFFRDNRQPGVAATPEKERQTIGLVAAFKARWKILSGLVCCAVINVAVGTGAVAWAPSLLHRKFETSLSDAGYLLGLMSLVGGVLGAPLAAELSDRWIRNKKFGGRLRGHPMFFSLLLVGLLLLSLGSGVATATSGFLLIATGLGAINSVSYAAIQDLSEEQFRGRMLAFFQFITLAVGYGAGPSIVAATTQFLFADPAAIDRAILVSGAPLCVVGLALSLSVLGHYPAIDPIPQTKDAPLPNQLGKGDLRGSTH